MIPVFIYADTHLARLGAEEVLRGPGVRIVATASSLSEIEDELAETPGAVVVTVAGAWKQLPAAGAYYDPDQQRAFPVVVLSEDLDPAFVVARLRAGARAVLPPDLPRPQLLAALQAVSLGLVAGLPDPAPVSASQGEAAGMGELLEPLTARELEVLRLMALGLANKQIAGRLNISDNTVKFHVAAILGKLSAASRTEAVAVGIRNGLVLL